MSVHTLPLPARSPAPPPLSREARPLTLGLDNIARRLGVERKSDRATIAYVRLLIAHSRFPAPFPYRRGTTLLTGAEAVVAHARWDRRAVEAWLDGQLPPGALAALTDAAAAERDAALDARADDLDALVAARRNRA